MNKLPIDREDIVRRLKSLEKNRSDLRASHGPACYAGVDFEGTRPHAYISSTHRRLPDKGHGPSELVRVTLRHLEG